MDKLGRQNSNSLRIFWTDLVCHNLTKWNSNKLWVQLAKFNFEDNSLECRMSLYSLSKIPHIDHEWRQVKLSNLKLPNRPRLAFVARAASAILFFLGKYTWYFLLRFYNIWTNMINEDMGQNVTWNTALMNLGVFISILNQYQNL